MAAVTKLAYMGFNVANFNDWHTILFDILGLEQRTDSPDGRIKLRYDQYHHRFTFIDSDADSVAFVGWEVDTIDQFNEMYTHLAGMGIGVELASDAEKQDRMVLELMKFKGPDNVPYEICFSPFHDNQPYTPSCPRFDGFNTGDLGLGHILYCHEDPKEAVEFYRQALGMKISDYIHWDEAKATFMHCNPRHHSIAVCNPCFGTGAGELNHFMLQAENIDDVGRAYDRVEELNVPLILTLGKHTNDKMTSFYMITPAGFAIEYGYGGEEIRDYDNWDIELYNAPKIWGHNLVE